MNNKYSVPLWPDTAFVNPELLVPEKFYRILNTEMFPREKNFAVFFANERAEVARAGFDRTTAAATPAPTPVFTN